MGDAVRRDEALPVIVIGRVRETAADGDGKSAVLVTAAVSDVVPREVTVDVDVGAIAEPLDDTEGETVRVRLDDCVTFGDIDICTGVTEEKLLTLADDVTVEVSAADRVSVTDTVTVANSELDIDGDDEDVAGSDSETVELALCDRRVECESSGERLEDADADVDASTVNERNDDTVCVGAAVVDVQPLDEPVDSADADIAAEGTEDTDSEEHADVDKVNASVAFGV